MEKEVKIYSFSYYDFTNDQTGEVIQGVKLFYVDPNSELKGENNSYGLEAGYVNLPYSCKDKLMGVKFPTTATLVLDVAPGKRVRAIDIINFK